MDPLTHMLAGAAIADSWSAGSKVGKGALPFAMFLAAAPDLDVIPALIAAFPSNPFSSSLFDADMMRTLHRGYTHAIPILAITAVVAGLAAWMASRKSGTRRQWVVLAALALTSHTLLDVVNGAVRAWLPFSQEWFGWGQTPEADPLLLVVLLLCLLVNHPPKFANARGLGTLEALERLGGWLHAKIGSRVGSRNLALLTLAVAALALIVRNRT